MVSLPILLLWKLSHDPNKELITTIGVKSIITQPNDDTERMFPGVHMIRGYAWSGAGAIAQVEVSVDGGETGTPPT